MAYQPSQEVLDKYADLLVNCALDGGEGMKKGAVVLCQVPECAKPFYVALRNAILKAGGHPIMQYLPDETSKEYFELATEDQIGFFPKKYFRGLIDEIDNSIRIVADTDKHELEGVAPAMLMLRQKTMQTYMDWRRDKENAGNFSWTLAMYGTEAMAAEVGLSLEDYWAEIIKACWLDNPDPIRKWKEILAETERVKKKLDSLQIQSVRVEAENTDLIVKIGDNREWLGGSGCNIPSFELFISPDWRGTEGHIQFTEPLYRYGNLITDVYLEFKEGKVVKATATKGEAVLKEMISQENADKIGEFSMTDRRVSRITKFMGETLFDENVGGEQGNTHLALGNAYRSGFTGDPSKVPDEEWDGMGFNQSSIHTDIVATSRRTVTAILKDGSKKVIYKDGEFTI